MTQYIIRRLIASIPSLILVSVIIFSLLRLVPGDVVMARLSQAGYVDKTQIVKMRTQLGLEQPYFRQYATYTGRILRGDFGTSLWTGKRVLPQIGDAMRVSLQLGVMAFLLAAFLAIPLGILSAIKRGTWIDYAARLFSILGLSIPDFWIATMLLLALTLWFHWLPQFGYWSLLKDPSRNLQATIFPALIVGYRLCAISARMTRSSMLEVLQDDYIRTAWSKGLRERVVVIRHALRNALIPVITILGGQLGYLLGGLVVIETIFALPGLGRLAFNAVTLRDYPVIQGVTMVMAVLFILVNLFIDVSYAVLDPRIRYS
ncbi:MAG: ABC transporter permease [Dehalococcoidia bacterium]